MKKKILGCLALLVTAGIYWFAATFVDIRIVIEAIDNGSKLLITAIIAGGIIYVAFFGDIASVVKGILGEFIGTFKTLEPGVVFYLIKLSADIGVKTRSMIISQNNGQVSEVFMIKEGYKIFRDVVLEYDAINCEVLRTTDPRVLNYSYKLDIPYKNGKYVLVSDQKMGHSTIDPMLFDEFVIHLLTPKE